MYFCAKQSIWLPSMAGHATLLRWPHITGRQSTTWCLSSCQQQRIMVVCRASQSLPKHGLPGNESFSTNMDGQDGADASPGNADWDNVLRRGHNLMHILRMTTTSSSKDHKLAAGSLLAH